MSDDLIGAGALDRPNSYIGRAVPRPNARRLLSGEGAFVDDLALPRMVHVAFVRSPHAHARIDGIDVAAAAASPGVVRVVTGPELARHVTPWVGTLTHLKGMKSAPQLPLAVERACWQGDAVAAVIADSRAAAEDGAARVEVVWRPLPAVTDMETALDPATPVIHPELGDNLTFRRDIETGAVDQAFADAAHVVAATFRTGRHTGVCLEGRSILADWSEAEQLLTVHHSHQAPHMMQVVFARHLGLAEAQVRVICRDVGGSYGIKVHAYPDELATAALARLLRRPVKFIADRLESFTTDIHARDHRIAGRLAVSRDGEILAIAIDDLTGIGPYSVYPRTSAIEGNQVIMLCGGPYAFANYRARTTVVLQNKTVTSQYRAVGHPIACAVTEGLVDLAAEKLGLDPIALRRRNLIPDDAYPCSSPSGYVFERLSHHACLDKLVALMDYDALRREQRDLRARGIHRGIGIASFIEVTNPSPAFYGIGGAPISAQDGCTIRLEPGGTITCLTGVTEQGQGTEAMIAQIAATAVGVPLDKVRVITGDTHVTPYGGGTWASRGTGIAGEATLQAAGALRRAILDVAGILLQAEPAALEVADGRIVDRVGGAARMSVEEVARVAYFRGDTLPKTFQAELVQTRHFFTKQYPFAFTNGVQASWLEVDVDTGFVTLLRHWVVEDCGRVVNPLLVDEQIRGGVVQGIGAALLEECVYDRDGQLRNGSLADYLVPMAAELPDIAVAHVATPTAETTLGAKGAGEAGTAGAPAAVMNAINDALAPLGAKIFVQPATPERILQALGKV
jgi:carbon-monoxide dehydrogenase large subunit